MNIQWYPGHMTRARREMEKDVKLVDLVIELRDARCPFSTENPDIRKIAGNRRRLILLNKADLADPEATKAWRDHYRSRGIESIALDARNRDHIGAVRAAASRLSEEKRERDKRRGITEERPLKALICGIPNIGKSTFINSVLGRASAKTGNKPGVTKGNQWITLSDGFMLLDTPGVLWPRFESEEVGINLALIGSINDEIVNSEELCIKLIGKLRTAYPDALMKRYDISPDELEKAMDSHEILPLGADKEALSYMDIIARRRGCLRRGAEPDYERCSRLVIDDFRSSRLGRISLEFPEEKMT